MLITCYLSLHPRHWKMECKLTSALSQLMNMETVSETIFGGPAIFFGWALGAWPTYVLVPELSLLQVTHSGLPSFAATSLSLFAFGGSVSRSAHKRMGCMWRLCLLSVLSALPEACPSTLAILHR